MHFTIQLDGLVGLPAQLPASALTLTSVARTGLALSQWLSKTPELHPVCR